MKLALCAALVIVLLVIAAMNISGGKISFIDAGKPAEATQTREQLSPDAEDFISYGNAYLAAKKSRTVDALQDEWKGRDIAWCGRVVDISETGTFFTIVPLSAVGVQPMDGVECGVFDCDPALIRRLRTSQTVHVTGQVHTISVLSVIIGKRLPTK